MFRKMSTGLFHTLSGYDLGGFSVLGLESLFQGFAGFILLKRFRFGKTVRFWCQLRVAICGGDWAFSVGNGPDCACRTLARYRALTLTRIWRSSPWRGWLSCLAIWKARSLSALTMRLSVLRVTIFALPILLVSLTSPYRSMVGQRRHMVFQATPEFREISVFGKSSPL